MGKGMSERSDTEVLRAFVRHGDQSAFADVVRRHLDLVYATALRKVEDTGAAEEIAQNVFSALARKAWRFAPDDSLPAWLYKTTLLEAKEWVRGELRRRRREQTAAELGTTMRNPDEQTAYRALVPLLDEALLSLREKDRIALLLRFYESQSLRQVGAALGTSEDTAQKRVAVALQKLSQFFQRRGFRTASVAAAAAALQQTATPAPGFMVTSVTVAAVKAVPVASGLTLLLGRLLSLTRAQMLFVCAIALLIPVVWRWQTTRTTLVNGTVSQQSQNLVPEAQPLPPKPPAESGPGRVTLAPLRNPSLAAPVTVETAQPQKQYTVHMVGFVNLPNKKIAMLEIQHQPSNANTHASIVREIVAEGKECTDESISDARVRLEFLQANFNELSVRMRENGKEIVYTLEGASTVPSGEWNVCLVNAGFDQVVDLYASLMHRTILCHPALNAIPVSAVANAKDSNDVVQALSNILLEKTQTATILDGDSFAVLAPSNRIDSVSAALEKIPYPTPAGPTLSGGSINFVNVPMSEAVTVYGEYINRRLVSGNSTPSFGAISFHNQTPLNKSEIIYAFDVLFSWRGCKAAFIGRDSFKMIPTKAP